MFVIKQKMERDYWNLVPFYVHGVAGESFEQMKVVKQSQSYFTSNKVSPQAGAVAPA